MLGGFYTKYRIPDSQLVDQRVLKLKLRHHNFPLSSESRDSPTTHSTKPGQREDHVRRERTSRHFKCINTKITVLCSGLLSDCCRIVS